MRGHGQAIVESLRAPSEGGPPFVFPIGLTLNLLHDYASFSLGRGRLASGGQIRFGEQARSHEQSGAGDPRLSGKQFCGSRKTDVLAV